VHGFLPDRTMFTQDWDDHAITPIWTFNGKNDANAQDPDVYEVCVCPECFFASGRIDWFSLDVAEGQIETSLRPDQIEAISNNIARGRDFVTRDPNASNPDFFAMPRESAAAYIAWKLAENTLRSASKLRAQTDGFEIARCNLMMCKFTKERTVLDQHIHTARAWLSDILEHKERYSTHRLVKSYVFHISLLLMEGKLGEAERALKTLVTDYREEEEFDFWLGRAEQMVYDEKANQ
jgi:hypothetical protein